jgi:hypothetical protein
LWRVASYSGPGLPKPTNSLIIGKIMAYKKRVAPKQTAHRSGPFAAN